MKSIPIFGKHAGLLALVDDGDYESVRYFKWYGKITGRQKTVYVYRNEYTEGKCYIHYLHRFLAGEPSGLLVDHRNGDSLDNQRINLRICSQSRNMQNLKRVSITKSSQFKGVTKRRDRYNKWVAQITVNGLRMNLGTFDSEIEAAIVYNNAASIYFGEFASVNVIEGVEICA